MITTRELYKVWKKAGMGISGFNAMRMHVIQAPPEEKGQFRSENDVSRLVPIFQEYTKFGEPLYEWILLGMTIFIGTWIFYLILAFSRVMTDYIEVSAALEILILTTVVVGLELLFYRIQMNHCKVEKPEKFVKSKKRSAFVVVESIIVLSALVLVCRQILFSISGLGFFNF